MHKRTNQLYHGRDTFLPLQSVWCTGFPQTINLDCGRYGGSASKLQAHGVFIPSVAIGKWEREDSVPNVYHLLATWQALVPDEDITFL